MNKEFSCRYHVGDYTYCADSIELLQDTRGTLTLGFHNCFVFGNDRQLIQTGTMIHVPLSAVEPHDTFVSIIRSSKRK